MLYFFISVILVNEYFRVFNMNSISPKKLLHSKWTAVKPLNKQKHFMVTDVEFDEFGAVIACYIEAIISNELLEIDWHDLKDTSRWLCGWK